MRSSRISLADVRRAWRLIGDAQALRHRPGEREAVLVDGLCRLFGGDNGFHLCIEDYRPGGRVEAKALVYGRVTDAFLDRWLNRRLGIERTLRDDVMVAHSIDRRHRTTVLTQASLLSRIDLKAFPVYAEAVSAYGLTDNLVLAIRPGLTHDLRAYAVHRRDRGTPFAPAQVGLAKLLACELRRQTDREHARPYLAGEVSGRPAQVLDRLLRGDAPKAVAEELSLSVYTVRDHVKTLLRHYDVHSIQALLAKFR